MTQEPFETASELMDDVGRNAGAGGPEFTDYVDAVVTDVVHSGLESAYQSVNEAYQSSDYDASTPPSGGDTGDIDDWSQPPSN